MEIKKPGDSTVQRVVEKLILERLANEHGISKLPDCLKKVKIDGCFKADECEPILVEIWAHQGKAKAGQQSKVMKDMCRLLLAEKILDIPCKKLIVVTDTEAVSFLEKSWQGEFAEKFGIHTIVIEIPQEEKDKIVDAQKEQCR